MEIVPKPFLQRKSCHEQTQLPSLSASDSELRMCQGPSSNSSLFLFRERSFSVHRPLFGPVLHTHCNASCSLTLMSQETKRSPHCSATCLSRLGVSMLRIENCLRLTHCFTAFWLCYTFHQWLDWQCLFFFDGVVTFLCQMTGNAVWQKFIFGVSLLLNGIFLCLIKYVFWLAAAVFAVWILKVYFSTKDLYPRHSG